MLLAGGLQTTLWFQFFGPIPSPLLWLVLIVYVSLYRSQPWSLWIIYALSFVLLSYSALSLGLIWALMLILYTSVTSLKNRFYWGGVGYFTLMVFFASGLFQMSYWILSQIVEKNPSQFLVYSRLGQILVTPLFAPVLFFLLKFLDRWTLEEEPLLESRGADS